MDLCELENAPEKQSVPRLLSMIVDGKFVGKFGTNGSKLGEFNEPFSVAVLSNDQIVVCDYNNHRTQICQLLVFT